MSTDGGYVQIYRSLLDHHAFRNQAEAMAFAALILRASWRPSQLRYKGRSISLQRGQLAVSIRDLANDLDRDKAWIERLFARLKRETMISTVVETGITVVTICNYDEYQRFSDVRETVSETRAETAVRQARDSGETQNNEGNEENTSEAKASSVAKRARSSSHPFPCPEGVDPIDWDALKANRQQKRAALSEGAHRQIMQKLDRWARDGWPPGPIVAHAAERGWTTVFETDQMKARPDATGNRSSGSGQHGTGFRDPVLSDLAYGVGS